MKVWLSKKKPLKDFTQKISQFERQIGVFENLESQVRQKVIDSIHNVAVNVGKTIGEEARKASLRATESIVHELSQSVYSAKSVLRDYQTEVITTQWKIIGIGAIVTILTCFLIFKLLMPSPMLPLSDKQIEYLHSGEMMELVWPKLSKKDKEHWEKLADKINHPDQDANNSSSSNE